MTSTSAIPTNKPILDDARNELKFWLQRFGVRDLFELAIENIVSVISLEWTAILLPDASLTTEF